MFDRKAAFWITSTLLVCMFVIFIILAVLVTPQLDLDGVSSDLAPVLESLNNMVWWMTVGFIMLPIMLLLLVLAIYFLFTSKNEVGPNANAAVGTNFLAPTAPKEVIKVAPANSNVTKAINSADALDLRYARGEVTRDQYVEMQRDLKKMKL